MIRRSLIIRSIIVITALVFAVRLFSIQIIDEDYKIAAENNVVQKIIQYPFRGLVYDSNAVSYTHLTLPTTPYV